MEQPKAVEADGSAERGVVYVGRIPHGFYEHQMREYFSQFGPVTRLRLSRNRKTGAPKHYAFIEFESHEVAKIAAATMHNYLLFGHILKCKLLAKENVHEDLWKGANKRFKAMPGNKIEGRKLALPAGKTEWKARQQKEEKKRAEMLKRTKKLGYEFIAPALKSVDDVQKTISDVEDPVETLMEEEKGLLTVGNGDAHGTTAVSEESKTTKKEKKKKNKIKDAEAEELGLVTTGNGDANSVSNVREVESSKNKKNKKAAKDDVESLMTTGKGEADGTTIEIEEVRTMTKQKKKEKRMVAKDEEKNVVLTDNGHADGTSVISEEVKTTKKKKKAAIDGVESLVTTENADAEGISIVREEVKSRKKKQKQKVAKDETDDVIPSIAKSTKRTLEGASSDVIEKPAKKAKKAAKKSVT